MRLDCAGRVLDLTRPRVMGVLNVTPDSFSGDGVGDDLARAIARARALEAAGAAIVDIGGESTRPGAAPVSAQQECDRVLPVIEACVRELRVPISVDTRHAAVMRAAVRAGAGLVNDVRALRGPDALGAAAALEVPVILMHMQGTPADMQRDPHYGEVVAEVRDFLAARIAAAVAAGVPRARVLVDPGFGFGKTAAHNLTLLRHLRELAPPGIPLVVGLSRKSLIGHVTGAPMQERLAGSVALAALAVRAGAHLVRAHDVAATVQAVELAHAVDRAA
jgi:dihydropteroate synthase